MIKVLLDTNIILDYALERLPFAAKAESIFKMAFQEQIDAYLTASSVTDIFYLLRKALGRQSALELLESLLDILDVIEVNKKVIIKALKSGMPDFEDAVQDRAAHLKNIDFIITRNIKDYAKAVTKTVSLDDFVNGNYK